MGWCWSWGSMVRIWAEIAFKCLLLEFRPCLRFGCLVFTLYRFSWPWMKCYWIGNSAGESNDKGSPLIEHNLTLPNPTYYLQPTAYNLLPTTYHLQPTTYHLQPTTYNLKPTTYNLPPTAYHLQPTTYNLPATSYHLQPTSYHLLTTTYHLQPTKMSIL